MRLAKVIPFYIFSVILLVAGLTFNLAYSQVHSSNRYKYLINPDNQKKHIDFICSASNNGRASGSEGAKNVAEYISKEFQSYGLIPFKGNSFLQKFSLGSGNYSSSGVKRNVAANQNGFNVAAYIPAESKNANYIIIGAHYDHLGAFDGKIFPGADDNASGVAALLELAKIFGQKYMELGKGKQNLIFVAFDANNLNMAGSKYFADRMGITPDKITCMINLDQIGSSLAPVSKNNNNYLLVLGIDKLKEWQKDELVFANEYFDINLQLDFTYYNSAEFYEIFYKLSDQQSFTQQAIPSLLFTSGITKHTNKESDSILNLNIPLLCKRIELIYRFLWLIQ